ncbi:MAG: hypothetical protein QOI24_3232 [Acidobacteriota bacterium]|nr:hypothetical protein [Acidobacteriota bacterium]
MPAELPVRTPPRWYAWLVLDGWIGFGWLIFLASGATSVLVFMASERAMQAAAAAPPVTTSAAIVTTSSAPVTTTAAPKPKSRKSRHGRKSSSTTAATTATTATTATIAPPKPVPVVPHQPPTLTFFAQRFTFTGYMFWSLYYGWAACWRLLLVMARRIFSAWAAVGCMYIGTVGAVFFLFGALYSFLGGGIYQFCKRWWMLAHGQRPAFVWLPPPAGETESRLAKLDDLARTGRISSDEYQRQREVILRDV